MVPRKDKQTTQPLNAEQSNGGTSRFRRKLSHGLSFISNPLSQRKTLPSGGPLESQMPEPPTRVRAFTTSDVKDNLRSPIYDSVTPVEAKGDVRHHTPITSDANRSESEDPDATPKPLPRSRTMSFIPRPARSGSESSAGDIDSPRLPALTIEEAASNTPTKIPTPSPPPDGPRRPSSRRYTHQYTSQQAKHIAAGAAFAGSGGQSPSKASVRSHTTPNLVQGPIPTQRTFMMPRKPAIQNKASSPPKTQRLALKENMPTSKQQASRRISDKQSEQLKRPSWGSQTMTSNRGSFGPNHSFDQSKQVVRTTPMKMTNRLSSNLSVQAPLTSKRTSMAKVEPLPASSVAQKSQGGSIAQPRLLGVVNPPTPAENRPLLPRASTERDLRRMTLGASSTRSGAPPISTCVTGINTEVRFPHSSLPRASTFHNLCTRREPPPPVPRIPEQYMSSPHSAQAPISYDQLRNGSTYGSRVVSKQKPVSILEDNTSTEAASSSSVLLPIVTDTNERRSTTSSPSVNATLDLLDTLRATYRFSPTSPRKNSETSDREQVADNDRSLQVVDSMPPLWWAGRFQTRFDQWRHDAMKAELDPRYKPEGLLAQCKLNQDKVAACYIFLQLRDLCSSHRAADSLWEFEYKYRQAHKLLGTTADPTWHLREQDGFTTSRQGTFGRAVRKLTPRKSSFVNLLKGKGWNRENTKPSYGSSEHDGLLSHGSSTTS
ncbi:hypothetical protein K491DRAFT_60967 [Lophiostoma macrostomum CBS 122681]|uniref:Uncharacterized protein n=1 Tax=Lophiostoma macrostomum CBS 122681 TaxID=1314788 RepID=A0A6A6TKC7_9PLEO|nr:hypothetical protein K491DRAFT_60967 [Lophiostoma macrostomum CBS 122681]